MDIIYNSVKVTNPYDTSKQIGDDNAFELSGVRSDFDYTNITAANFKADLWAAVIKLYRETAFAVWSDFKSKILNYGGAVRIKSTTSGCSSYDSNSSNHCSAPIADGKKGIAFWYKKNCFDRFKAVTLEKLYLNVNQDVNGAIIYIIDPSSPFELSYTIDLKKGKNDILSLINLGLPLILHASQKEASFILVDAGQFSIPGGTKLMNKYLDCPSCGKSRCEHEFNIYSVSNPYDYNTFNQVVRGVHDAQSYGFEFSVNSVCDLNQIIELYTTKNEIASLFAARFMELTVRNMITSGNANYKIIFGKQATEKEIIVLRDEYNSLLKTLVENIHTLSIQSGSNSCIEVVGKPKGMSPFNNSL